MNKTIITIIITAIVSVSIAESRHFFTQDVATDTETKKSAIYSPYAGQEARGIKALSRGDIEGLLSGAGTPFGGMAKPAELSGYPGPRHVLDAIEAGEFEVTSEQKIQIENLYEEMKTQAITLGKQIIAIEQKIDDEFTNQTVTDESLRKNISDSARMYEQLRFVHLKYHLQMVDILTPQQVEQYNLLRGYIGDNDPCENIPEGHDAELWKAHNDCKPNSPKQTPPVSSDPKDPVGIGCTEEGKLCPDGSVVGRTGPRCEFAPCPGESTLSETEYREPCDMPARVCPNGTTVDAYYIGTTCEYDNCPQE